MNRFRRLAAATLFGMGLLFGATQPAAAETTVVPAGTHMEQNCRFIGYLLVPHGDHYDVYEVYQCT